MGYVCSRGRRVKLRRGLSVYHQRLLGVLIRHLQGEIERRIWGEDVLVAGIATERERGPAPGVSGGRLDAKGVHAGRDVDGIEPEIEKQDLPAGDIAVVDARDVRSPASLEHGDVRAGAGRGVFGQLRAGGSASER